MCCQCGIFDLKEGATFEEVANRIEIYKKCGKEVVSTPVQGLRFNNFLLYVANDSYFGRTVQSLQAKHSIDANDKKLKELGLYKPVAKWQWQDKKLMMERLKPYFEDGKKKNEPLKKLRKQKSLRQFSLSVKPI